MSNLDNPTTVSQKTRNAFTNVFEGLASSAATRNYLNYASGAGTVFVVMGVMDADHAKSLVDGAQQFMDGLGQMIGGAKLIFAAVLPAVGLAAAKFAGLSSLLRNRIKSVVEDPQVMEATKIVVADPKLAAEIPGPQVVTPPGAHLGSLLVAVLAAGLLLTVLVPEASAQTALQRAAQRNDVNRTGAAPAAPALIPPGGLVDKFYAVTEADLRVAVAYAEFGEDQSAVLCYTEWLKQVEGIRVLREKYPDPDGVQLITAFQKVRNLVKRLDTDSPLRRACAALAADAKSDVKSVITGLLSGVLLKTMTGGLGIP